MNTCNFNIIFIFTDIDECKIVIPPVCGTNSNCTNIDGSYVCNCSSTDYYSPANDGKDCIGKFVCVCVCVCMHKW